MSEVICGTCGVLVADQKLHDEWHQTLRDALSALTALFQI